MTCPCRSCFVGSALMRTLSVLLPPRDFSYVFRSFLRQNNRGVGTNSDIAAAWHPICAGLTGGSVIREMIAKIAAVPIPIAIEPDFPQTVPRKPDRIRVVRLVRKVDHHDDVVARPSAVPTVKRDHLGNIVHVKYIQRLPFQSGGVIEQVPPQADHISIHRQDAAERLLLRPVQWLRVAEIAVLEEFLPLKDHRNPRSRESHRSAQCRTFLRKVVFSIAGPDFLRNPS